MNVSYFAIGIVFIILAGGSHRAAMKRSSHGEMADGEVMAEQAAADVKATQMQRISAVLFTAAGIGFIIASVLD